MTAELEIVKIEYENLKNEQKLMSQVESGLKSEVESLETRMEKLELREEDLRMVIDQKNQEVDRKNQEVDQKCEVIDGLRESLEVLEKRYNSESENFVTEIGQELSEKILILEKLELELTNHKSDEKQTSEAVGLMKENLAEKGAEILTLGELVSAHEN